MDALLIATASTIFVVSCLAVGGALAWIAQNWRTGR
jgi:hypothetical protein